MSRFNEHALILTLAAASVLAMAAPTNARAGVDADPPGAVTLKSGAATDRSNKSDSTALSARRVGKHRATLRCWQEGKLVYESAGVAPIGRNATSIEFRGADGEGSLQLLDLKHGLCVLDTPTGP